MNYNQITFDQAAYPQALKQLADSPSQLYIIGDQSVLAELSLAIVGSRSPTVTGRETAFQFAKHLASRGLTIVSGLALGIDGAAHRGALAVGGKTIAVLGAGIDNIYPPQHRDLVEQIIKAGGAVISEYAPGTPVRRGQFPQRNRIISGLSVGTLVVEATVRSGSLITARLAGEQGREVFAIPGSIHNPQSRGCHQLIRQGAKLVETAQDIIEEIAHLCGNSALSQSPVSHGAPTASPFMHAEVASAEMVQDADHNKSAEGGQLDDAYRTLLECVGFEATPVDVLVERSGYAAAEVASMILLLELQGYVAQTGQGYMKIKND